MGFSVTVKLTIYYPDAENRADADNEAMNLLGMEGVANVEVLDIEEDDPENPER